MKHFRIFSISFFSFFLFSFLLCLPLANANPHKFYTSITQIEYNQKTQSYEIIMNVFMDDWEKALTEIYQKPIRADHPEIENFSMQYLESCFVLKYKEKKLAYKMIGIEPEKDILKIYLELPHKWMDKGLLIKNDCLIREFEGQVNIVNILQQSERKTLIFKSIQQFQEIK